MKQTDNSTKIPKETAEALTKALKDTGLAIVTLAKELEKVAHAKDTNSNN